MNPFSYSNTSAVGGSGSGGAPSIGFGIVPVSGDQLLPSDGIVDGSQTNSNAIDRRLALRPLSVYGTFSIDRVSARINNGANSGRFLRVAIYDSDANGQPNDLVHSVELPAVANGTVNSTTSFEFTPGIYWTGLHANFGGIQIRMNRVQNITSLYGTATNNDTYPSKQLNLVLGDNGWNGPLPTNASSASLTNNPPNNIARFTMRVA